VGTSFRWTLATSPGLAAPCSFHPDLPRADRPSKRYVSSQDGGIVWCGENGRRDWRVGGNALRGCSRCVHVRLKRQVSSSSAVGPYRARILICLPTNRRVHRSTQPCRRGERVFHATGRDAERAHLTTSQCPRARPIGIEGAAAWALGPSAVTNHPADELRVASAGGVPRPSAGQARRRQADSA
jgi:hypothetical protein